MEAGAAPLPVSVASLPQDVWVLGPNVHSSLAWYVKVTQDRQMTGDQGQVLGERRAPGQGGQELGLTFGSNNPVAQEIQEVTGIDTKRGWEAKLAPCPSTSTFTHTGKGAGR